MVGMLDYHLHYALMATEDRVKETLGERRDGRPLRPHRRLRMPLRRRERPTS